MTKEDNQTNDLCSEGYIDLHIELSKYGSERMGEAIRFMIERTAEMAQEQEYDILSEPNGLDRQLDHFLVENNLREGLKALTGADEIKALGVLAIAYNGLMSKESVIETIANISTELDLPVSQIEGLTSGYMLGIHNCMQIIDERKEAIITASKKSGYISKDYPDDKE